VMDCYFFYCRISIQKNCRDAWFAKIDTTQDAICFKKFVGLVF